MNYTMPEPKATEPKILFAGATLIDVVGYLESPIIPWEKNSMLTNGQLVTGGGGANAAIACAELSQIFDLKSKIVLATRLGDGPNSSIARRCFDRRNVMTINLAPDAECDLGLNLVMCGPKGRTIGAHNKDLINWPELSSDLHRLPKADLVHIHGSTPKISHAVATHISQNSNAPILLDTSKYDEALPGLLSVSTHAIMPDELRIPIQDVEGQSSWQKVLTYLEQYPNLQLNAAMCGSEPTRIQEANSLDISEIPLNVTDKFKMVDNLGAGDVARGALCLALAHLPTQKGEDFNTAMEFAMAAATLSCTRYGRSWATELKKNPKIMEEETGYGPRKLLDRIEEAKYKSLTNEPIAPNV